MNKKIIDIGIVIPTLNEGKYIGKLLDKIELELKQAEIDHYTVCVVDGGSQDETLDVIRRFSLKNNKIHLLEHKKRCKGCQRGAASLAGLEWLIQNSSHQIFTDIDADGAQQPDEMVYGASQISVFDFDVAIASKYLFNSQVINRTPFRRFASFFYNLLARLLIESKIRDYSNNYRFYSRRAAECVLQLKPQYTSPVYLLEILVMWIANSYRIIEFPSRYVENTQKQSKVIPLDFVKGLLGTLDIAIKFHLGRYKLNDSSNATSQPISKGDES